MGIDAKLLWRWTLIGIGIHITRALLVVAGLGYLAWEYLLH